MLKLLDLFSGIGGFSLGLERTGGFETVAFCEINKFCQTVLRKHWPNVRQYTDIKTLTAAQLTADGITVDAICGGFPCQDISVAGANAGMGEGTRSGLWGDYARLIGELRPRYVIVENVSALLGRGLDRVLGDLAQIGYDAEWHCIPASAVGAPHRRDRVWVVAHTVCGRCGAGCVCNKRDNGREIKEGQSAQFEQSSEASSSMAQPACIYAQRLFSGSWKKQFRGSGGWPSEPNVGRVAHGVPARVDRLKSLGNAVVPQIPELIGRAILSAEAASPQEEESGLANE